MCASSVRVVKIEGFSCCQGPRLILSLPILAILFVEILVLLTRKTTLPTMRAAKARRGRNRQLDSAEGKEYYRGRPI